MPAALHPALEPAYVAGLFRSARFGIDEAHGLAWSHSSATCWRRALEIAGAGRFRAVSEKFPGAIHDLLILRGNGDYAGDEGVSRKARQSEPSATATIGWLADMLTDIRMVP